MTLISDAPGIAARDVITWTAGAVSHTHDSIAVEEPLEIRLAGVPVAVTMRTPGEDFDLATGFLLTERILRSPDEIASISHCDLEDAAMDGNVVNVNPADPSLVDPARWDRRMLANSACGVCGKAGLERVRLDVGPIDSSLQLDPAVVPSFPEALRRRQGAFDRTGGIHAAGMFDVSGELVAVREDVGRHNAVDKVIGAVIRGGTRPPAECVLVVSSRASFEIVQKALAVGIPAVAAVSAPSSLAVDLARETGMTLIGFLRGTRFNLYAGAERLAL